ncbi:MAG: hypothetical protein ACI379_11990 [Nocardioides sp.]|uniref:hypothetical protein n=1 Tax=Nocardioides sp. TaxID=35761 RepID=UPI003EFEB131
MVQRPTLSAVLRWAAPRTRVPALALVPALVLGGCASGETHDREPTSAPTSAAPTMVKRVDAGPAGAEQGPCPASLADPADDHGFGPDEPGAATVRVGAPATTVTLCRYRAVEDGPAKTGNGIHLRWDRTGQVRELAPARAARVSELVTSLEPSDPLQACFDDIGGRWLLALRTGDTYDWVAVDDFGCRRSRLTDDVLATAPGEDARAGTYATPPALLRLLARLAPLR